jgi:hypothetical protein
VHSTGHTSCTTTSCYTRCTHLLHYTPHIDILVNSSRSSSTIVYSPTTPLTLACRRYDPDPLAHLLGRSRLQNIRIGTGEDCKRKTFLLISLDLISGGPKLTPKRSSTSGLGTTVAFVRLITWTSLSLAVGWTCKNGLSMSRRSINPYTPLTVLARNTSSPTRSPAGHAGTSSGPA